MIGLHISRSPESDAIWIRLQGDLDLAAVEELAASLSAPMAQPFVVDLSTLQPVADAVLAALFQRLSVHHISIAGLTRHQERLIQYLASPAEAVAA